MPEFSSIRLKQLHGRLGDVIYQLTRVQFARHSEQRWRPCINAYRCRDGMVICVELAGVDRDSINLEAQIGRLVLRGTRTAPEPDGTENKPVQILAMEIEQGPFEREIPFPAQVEPARISAWQENGLLWIQLPFRATA